MTNTNKREINIKTQRTNPTTPGQITNAGLTKLEKTLNNSRLAPTKDANAIRKTAASAGTVGIAALKGASAGTGIPINPAGAVIGTGKGIVTAAQNGGINYGTRGNITENEERKKIQTEQKVEKIVKKETEKTNQKQRKIILKTNNSKTKTNQNTLNY